METMLKELVDTARREQAVASQSLDDDMTMLVYPDAGDTLLVALGYRGEHAHRAPASQLVRKRSADLQRYGDWLPTMFTDGSIYVAVRARFAGDDVPLISAESLAAAQELLT